MSCPAGRSQSCKSCDSMTASTLRRCYVKLSTKHFERSDNEAQPMKKFLLDAVKTGVPFGVVMGLYFSTSGANGIAMGIANGVAFGCAMAAFMAWQQKRSKALLAQY